MRPFYFAIFAPAMVLIGIGVGLGNDTSTGEGFFRAYVASALFVLTPLALADPRRFWWVLRIVAGLIFLACIVYVCREAIAWMAGKPFNPGRGVPSLRNAIKALTVYGLPAAGHAFFGWGRSLVSSMALRRRTAS
jgi:hypothetical protein